METKAQFAATDHAEFSSSYRKDTPVFLIEKFVAYLKEKYDGPLDLAVDAGCGSGQSTVNLAKFFKKVHATDISEERIQEAKANRTLPNITYETARGEIIPFNDGSVQLVSALCSFHWFKLDVFFSEVRRALCNNGILVIYMYNAMKPLLDNPALSKEIDELWNELNSILKNYCDSQVLLNLDLHKNDNFPFKDGTKFDVREIFDGELQDIMGYISALSAFQNWKRLEENKATEFFAHVKKKFRDIVAALNLDPDKPLKLYRDFNVHIRRKVPES